MVNDMPRIRGSQTPVREFYPARRAVQPLRRGALLESGKNNQIQIG